MIAPMMLVRNYFHLVWEFLRRFTTKFTESKMYHLCIPTNISAESNSGWTKYSIQGLKKVPFRISRLFDQTNMLHSHSPNEKGLRQVFWQLN